MPEGAELQRLRPDHAPALVTFEQENRSYFAASVPDRGDEYFGDFAARHDQLLADQDTGVIHFHVLVTDDGEVVGRVNLVDVAGGSAAAGDRALRSSGPERRWCRSSIETWR
ncbi:MAG: [ribosomal protein S5]-alanine N-acetyltransferase [Kribbellaceae bacterium]|nr:[ribosomal protein S5]-alanine N-acetyltransferase [Kribbellaceae bacterium]